MTLVDANLLLYASDSESGWHERARDWLSEKLNGPVRVGIPWPSLVAFLRIATHPRVFRDPLSPTAAGEHVRAWLAAPACWIPLPTPRHAEVLGDLVQRYQLSAKLIPDAHLVALAIEHGLQVCSADTDFARFAEARWLNPLD